SPSLFGKQSPLAMAAFRMSRAPCVTILRVRIAPRGAIPPTFAGMLVAPGLAGARMPRAPRSRSVSALFVVLRMDAATDCERAAEEEWNKPFHGVTLVDAPFLATKTMQVGRRFRACLMFEGTKPRLGHCHGLRPQPRPSAWSKNMLVIDILAGVCAV